MDTPCPRWCDRKHTSQRERESENESSFSFLFVFFLLVPETGEQMDKELNKEEADSIYCAFLGE